MTDAFYSFRDFYFSRNVLHLGGKSAVVELMCHPGNEPFRMETELLMNAKEWLNSEYKLTNYNKIGEA